MFRFACSDPRIKVHLDDTVDFVCPFSYLKIYENLYFLDQDRKSYKLCNATGKVYFSPSIFVILFLFMLIKLSVYTSYTSTFLIKFLLLVVILLPSIWSNVLILFSFKVVIPYLCYYASYPNLSIPINK